MGQPVAKGKKLCICRSVRTTKKSDFSLSAWKRLLERSEFRFHAIAQRKI